jgi:predicted transcriptional regulator
LSDKEEDEGNDFGLIPNAPQSLGLLPPHAPLLDASTRGDSQDVGTSIIFSRGDTFDDYQENGEDISNSDYDNLKEGMNAIMELLKEVVQTVKTNQSNTSDSFSSVTKDLTKLTEDLKKLVESSKQESESINNRVSKVEKALKSITEKLVKIDTAGLENIERMIDLKVNSRIPIALTIPTLSGFDHNSAPVLPANIKNPPSGVPPAIVNITDAILTSSGLTSPSEALQKQQKVPPSVNSSAASDTLNFTPKKESARVQPGADFR